MQKEKIQHKEPPRALGLQAEGPGEGHGAHSWRKSLNVDLNHHLTSAMRSSVLRQGQRFLRAQSGMLSPAWRRCCLGWKHRQGVITEGHEGRGLRPGEGVQPRAGT